MLIDLQRRASLVGYPEPIRGLLASQPELIPRSFRNEWFTADQLRVATKGEYIVGFAVLERSDPQEAEITALFVEPAHWRTGVGRALVGVLVTLASQWGQKKIWVLANPLALGFYAATGFVRDRYVDMANASAVPRLTLEVHSIPKCTTSERLLTEIFDEKRSGR
jgi:N-acetylglutamate synthase-like GNAT family acetyltransferase